MTAPIPTGLRRAVVASTAGTVVEWSEFFLYGTAAKDATEFAAERQAAVG
jgi:hypothetical protein